MVAARVLSVHGTFEEKMGVNAKTDVQPHLQIENKFKVP